ncbi:hypothetical protein [Ekhidna sp.]|uniref:hypothetical protein n=1 Tax=Ekhidna sp. TaxID=2608089 RepID=UPI003B5CC31E
MDPQIEKVVDQALRIDEPFKRTTFLQACCEKFRLDEEEVIKAMNVKLIQRRNQN